MKDLENDYDFDFERQPGYVSLYERHLKKKQEEDAKKEKFLP